MATDVRLNFPTQKETSVDTTIRLALLDGCKGRTPTQYTVTAAAAGTSVADVTLADGVDLDDVTLTVNALSGAIPNRAKIVFANGIEVRLTAAAGATDTSLNVEPVTPCNVCHCVKAGTELIPTGTVGTYTAGSLAQGTEILSVNPLPVALWVGEKLDFNGVEVTVAGDVPMGSSELPVVATDAAVSANDTATAYGSYYIAGATDASPTATPKLQDSTNFASGAGYEQQNVGVNYTMGFSFQEVFGCPGTQLMYEILYGQLKESEVYVWLERKCGTSFEGAAIPTSGSQSSAVQSLIVNEASLQFQGEVLYSAYPGAPQVVFN
ncbi:MAG: hypothetical protein F6K65_20430 [Moorea sp. SIO3C2]|nr:hypothetical protein [Moorena sp. SIO3C2]